MAATEIKNAVPQRSERYTGIGWTYHYRAGLRNRKNE
jgi:hypothetical protein